MADRKLKRTTTTAMATAVVVGTTGVGAMLGRGRRGPRCMSCPIHRDPLPGVPS